MANKYRFLSKDEFNKPCHRHQILVGDKWIDATGASTITSVLEKSGLTYWASGLAVKEFSGIENCKLLTKIKNKKATSEEFSIVESSVIEWLGKNKDITSDDYIQTCINAYFAHTIKLSDSAEAGVDLHADLEEYVKWCMKEGGKPRLYSVVDGNYKVKEFANWAMLDIKRFIFSEAHMYDEKLFVGGISDVGAEMMDGSYAIIDFKSAKEAYFSAFVQEAIYNLLLESNGLVDENGALILDFKEKISKYLVIPFGAKEFTVYENSNVEELKKAALSCINLYRAKAHFDEK